MFCQFRKYVLITYLWNDLCFCFNESKPYQVRNVTVDFGWKKETIRFWKFYELPLFTFSLEFSTFVILFLTYWTINTSQRERLSSKNKFVPIPWGETRSKYFLIPFESFFCNTIIRYFCIETFIKCKTKSNLIRMNRFKFFK